MLRWNAFWQRLKARWPHYPRQFWLLVGGMFLSSAGTSMVWPFLALYVSRRLQVPLAQVGFLITLQAAAGVVGTILAGPVVDRWGRKTGMILSLLGMGLGYLGLAFARALPQFALAMGVGGLFAPAYRIGGDAMTADLIPPQGRDEAYALMRTASNAGISIGPAVGGWLAVVSYRWAFFAATGSLLAYVLLLAAGARETRPTTAPTTAGASNDLGQAWQVLRRDGRLWAFLLPMLLTWMTAGLMWIFLGVYMRDQFGLGENLYGLIITTNAVMVTFLQYPVTAWAQRYSPRWRMVAGSLIYALAVGGVMWGRTFWHFWSAMVVMTVGEMLLVPTASTWVANLAPPHLRGSYMATLSFMWAVGAGVIAPLGGWLNDQFNPRAPWLFGALLGLTGALAFAWQRPPTPTGPQTPTPNHHT